MAILASSTTTIFGFLALMFMSFSWDRTWVWCWLRV